MSRPRRSALWLLALASAALAQDAPAPRRAVTELLARAEQAGRLQAVLAGAHFLGEREGFSALLTWSGAQQANYVAEEPGGVDLTAGALSLACRLEAYGALRPGAPARKALLACELGLDGGLRRVEAAGLVAGTPGASSFSRAEGDVSRGVLMLRLHPGGEGDEPVERELELGQDLQPLLALGLLVAPLLDADWPEGLNFRAFTGYGLEKVPVALRREEAPAPAAARVRIVTCEEEPRTLLEVALDEKSQVLELVTGQFGGGGPVRYRRVDEGEARRYVARLARGAPGGD